MKDGGYWAEEGASTDPIPAKSKSAGEGFIEVKHHKHVLACLESSI